MPPFLDREASIKSRNARTWQQRMEDVLRLYNSVIVLIYNPINNNLVVMNHPFCLNSQWWHTAGKGMSCLNQAVTAKVCIILSNRREWLELVEATETESLATLAQTQQFPWEFAIRLKFLTLYFWEIGKQRFTFRNTENATLLYL